MQNGAVEQCPGGASVSNSWFSRSGAEGECPADERWSRGPSLLGARDHPLDPLVGRSVAEANKRIFDPRGIGAPRSGAPMPRSAANLERSGKFVRQKRFVSHYLYCVTNVITFQITVTYLDGD